MACVYKFGGASLSDADGFKNVCNITLKHKGNIVVIVSASGKTTNKLEEVVELFLNSMVEDALLKLKNIINAHKRIANELLHNSDLLNECNTDIDIFHKKWIDIINSKPSLHHEFENDRIVSLGEELSSLILHYYFTHRGEKSCLIDIKEVIRTDNKHGDAKVDWELSQAACKEKFNFNDTSIYISQGYIGSTIRNITTTLGREGSDYSGAIVAACINAESLTIWKDVPGVLNADPKWFKTPVLLKEIPYAEAIELSYYGAQVIHPKTLKPLYNRNIPLYVKSFKSPNNDGTLICVENKIPIKLPIYILKKNQLFVTISTKDMSFIFEDELIEILNLFKEAGIKLNLLQTSALNVSICIDNSKKSDALMEKLNERYKLRYNTDVDLLTIRNYDSKLIKEIVGSREVVDTQLTRNHGRFILK